MNELDRALADVAEIRSRIAQASEFRGLGPAALAASGGLAFAVAALQSLLPGATTPAAYFTAWTLTAVAAAGLIGAEMLRRADRHHAGLADQMIREAVLSFLPAGVAGAALLAVFARFAPALLPLLPGLWLILTSLGIFAASRALPRAIVYGAAWYFVAGFAVLLLGLTTQQLSPWAMGLPFAIGQLAIAAIVHLDARSRRDAS